MQDEGDYERPPTMSTTVSERQTRLLLTIELHSLHTLGKGGVHFYSSIET